MCYISAFNVIMIGDSRFGVTVWEFAVDRMVLSHSRLGSFDQRKSFRNFCPFYVTGVDRKRYVGEDTKDRYADHQFNQRKALLQPLASGSYLC